MSLSHGNKLGPYEIVAPLGAGGMGEVHHACDTRLDRIVAVKISFHPIFPMTRLCASVSSRKRRQFPA